MHWHTSSQSLYLKGRQKQFELSAASLTLAATCAVTSLEALSIITIQL